MLKITSIIFLFFICDYTSYANNESTITATNNESTTATDNLIEDRTTEVPTSDRIHITDEAHTTGEFTTTDTSLTTQDEGFDPRKASFWSIPVPDILGCGKEFSCIRYAVFNTIQCTGIECEYMLAYRVIPEDDSVEFFMAARNAHYVAVGFKKNEENTEIILCSAEMNEMKVATYIWNGSELKEIPASRHLMLEEARQEATNGLWCNVKRPLASWDSTNIISLNDNFKQVYLWGDVDNTGKPIISDWYESDFQTSLKSKLNVTRTMSKSDLTAEEVDCEKMNCVRYYFYSSLKDQNNYNCNYKDCTYLLAFQKDGLSSSKWPLILSANNADFVAVGLTPDAMTKKPAEVMGCKKNKDGQIEMFHSWYSSPSQSYPQKQHSEIELLHGNSTKKGLWCNLVRPVKAKGTTWNLSVPMYLLYIWGPVDKDGEPSLWKSSYIYPSKEKIDLKADSHFGQYTQQYSSGGETNFNVYRISLMIEFFLIALFLS